jgi:hypothetical protein
MRIMIHLCSYICFVCFHSNVISSLYSNSYDISRQTYFVHRSFWYIFVFVNWKTIRDFFFYTHLCSYVFVINSPILTSNIYSSTSNTVIILVNSRWYNVDIFVRNYMRAHKTNPYYFMGFAYIDFNRVRLDRREKEIERKKVGRRSTVSIHFLLFVTNHL